MIAVGIVVAAVAAFILSSTYYSVVPASAIPNTDKAPPPWKIALELVRSALVAGLVAGLLAAGDWDRAGQGAVLGLALFTVPVVLLSGSVSWEGVPVRTALAHAGDWLVKLIVIGAIVGAFA